MQDQSRGWTQQSLDWFRPSRGVTTIRPILLYYAMQKLWVTCPRCVTGYYFYSQKNHLIDMASFWLCYDFNKYTSDRNSILVLYPTSWAIATTGPLVRVNTCVIITSPWTCHQFGHLGFRSDYQAISTPDQTPPWTASLMHRVHFFFFTSTPAFDPPMFLQPDAIPGWWCVRYTLMSPTQVSITVWPTHLCVLFSKKLNRLYVQCTMHGSQKWHP
jgi:hypothetical protein